MKWNRASRLGLCILCLCSYGSTGAFATSSAPVYRGKASKNCTCTRDEQGESEPIRIVTGEEIGSICRTEQQEVHCEIGSFAQIVCSASCITLQVAQPLTTLEIDQMTDEAVKRHRPVYTERVPARILEQIKKKYPDWMPALEKKGDAYDLSFSLQTAYLEAPIRIQDPSQTVSIVYFFQSREHFKQGRLTWSFWSTHDGKLVHESIAPYNVSDGLYSNRPCIAPAGLRLETIVLSGIAAGPMDAAPCCGPYSLEKLATKGPILLTDAKAGPAFDPEFVYPLCDRSIDRKTGKYRPKDLHEISGPANLRSLVTNSSGTEKDGFGKDGILALEKSPIIGQCADHARVVVSGSRGDWFHVYCEGKSGFTHRKNIRWKK